MRRTLAVVGILIGVGVALAYVLMGGSAPKYRSHAEADRANAAILVAKCDAAMSTLDNAMESAKADPALAVQRTSKLIADRLTTCTKAQAAAQRAKAVSKNDAQLDVAIERVAKHLERLTRTSPASASAGSAAMVGAGSN